MMGRSLLVAGIAGHRVVVSKAPVGSAKRT